MAGASFADAYGRASPGLASQQRMTAKFRSVIAGLAISWSSSTLARTVCGLVMASGRMCCKKGMGQERYREG